MIEMPTVLYVNGFRFFFYSSDGDEPCHVHVQKGEGDGKIWLEPEIREEYLEGFKNQEKRIIRTIIQENRRVFIDNWNEYFK